MNVPRARLVGFFVIAGIVVGCSASTTTLGGGAGSGGASVADFCASYCKKLNTCDTTRDAQTCTNSCGNKYAATLPKIRGDVVGLMETCFQNKDCMSVLKGNSISNCASEASASIAPSDAATGFCNAFVAAESKCGRTKDKAKCLNEAKLYTDATINEANACTAKACTEIEPCTTATFGGVTSSSGATDDTSSSIDGGVSVPTADASASCTLAQSTGYSSCDACVKSSCCSSYNACFSTSECRSYSSCHANCAQSASCVSSCASSYPAGKYDWDYAESCVQSYCYSSCGTL